MAFFNRDRRGGGGFGGGRRDFDRRDRGDRQMFKTICDNCGKDCEVPFRPTEGKPVYCNDCFSKQGRDSGPRRFDNRDNRGGGRPSIDLSEINSKLDKIIGLLHSKSSSNQTYTESPISVEAIMQKPEEKPETPKKKKKAAKKSAEPKEEIKLQE